LSKKLVNIERESRPKKKKLIFSKNEKKKKKKFFFSIINFFRKSFFFLDLGQDWSVLLFKKKGVKNGLFLIGFSNVPNSDFRGKIHGKRLARLLK